MNRCQIYPSGDYAGINILQSNGEIINSYFEGEPIKKEGDNNAIKIDGDENKI